MNFPFTPSSQDQSVYFLGKIFGRVGTVLTPTEASQVLGTMFNAFNTVILGVGTFIVLYVTVVGVMKTAHEGEFLGKQWNNIWIPIRMVLGIAALVPTTSGYSAIQIIVMWIILQGVGAADYIWGQVLSYSDSFGSPLATAPIPTVGVQGTMAGLFQSLVCQESARASYDYPPGGSNPIEVGYYCASPSGKTDGGFCGATQDESSLWNIRGSQSTTRQSTYTFQNPLKSGDERTTTGTSTLYTYKMGPNGKCGTMTFCGDDSACSDQTNITSKIRCATCKAQGDALQSIVTAMSTIAQKFVQADYDYRVFMTTNAGANENQEGVPDWISNFCASIGATETGACTRASAANPKGKINAAYSTGTDGVNAQADTVQNVYWPFYIKAGVSGDINFISASANNYTAAIQKAVSSVMNQATPVFTGENKEWLTEAYNVGWIFAGAYYYNLAKGNDNNAEASIPDLTITPIDPKSDPSNFMSSYRNNFEAASILINEVQAQTQNQNNQALGTPFSPQLSELNKLSDGLNSSASDIMNIFYNMLSGAKQGDTPTNPLFSLQNVGKWLLIIAQILFALIMAVIPALLLLGYFFPSALGNFVTNPVGPTVSSIILLFTPLFAVFIGALFTFGALLAVYTPLIPYIIFTMGAIVWFILVIEAMVAAPIMALGILSPSGHHEILGKAEQGLMLVLGLFLRPTLMIFGLIAAMLLAIVVVTMINQAFSGVMGQVYSNPGLVEIILFLGAYVGLILAALNKCYALIHIIPDQALRWIGGHQESAGGAGAQEGLGGAKGGVQASAAEAQGVGAGMAKRGEGVQDALRAKLKEKMKSSSGAAQPTVTPTKPPKP